MTELLTITIVTGNNDWQGIYVNGNLKYENHTVSIENDISLNEDQAINEINKENYDMERLGITRLPDTLETLEEYSEFANTVENNKDEWENKIKDAFQNIENEYIRTDDSPELFNISEDKGRILFSLFSKINEHVEMTTPLADFPLVELDYEHCEDNHRAYKFKDSI